MRCQSNKIQKDTFTFNIMWYRLSLKRKEERVYMSIKSSTKQSIEDDVGNSDFGQSITGKVWRCNKPDSKTLLQFEQAGIDTTLSTILINRNISNPDQAAGFLDPKLKDLLPNPFDLLDMEKAADRIADAVINKEQVTIFGDYDVDGATSSALLKKFLYAVGLKPEVYIPHRLNEGYGPNKGAMDKIKNDHKSSLLVTVDCGIVSFEPLEYAKSIGLDVIILDHHLSQEKLPKVDAIVNPNRFDEEFEYKNLAAVGVVFLTTIAIRSKLRDKGFFKDGQFEEPDLMQYLDLVALGTVCDVMRLVGINRAFVHQGLKLIKQRKNLGLATLANVVGMDAIPKSHHLGFVIGPRINACGRVGEGHLGPKLLSTNDSIEAFAIAKKLDKLNDDRRSIEHTILEHAIEQIQSNSLHEKPVIMVYGKQWHLGILGVIASKLKEKYGKPSAAISIIDGEAKGSARSIPGIDFGTALSNAKEKGLILEGGGHAMAGGFTVDEKKLQEFYDYMIERAQQSPKSFEEAKIMDADFTVNVEAINFDLATNIEKAAPFGNGNQQPRVIIENALVLKASLIRQSHIMLIVRDKYAISDRAKTLKAMVYRAMDRNIADYLIRSVGKTLNLIGTLQFNNWYLEKVDFVVEDVAKIKQ